MKTYIINMDSAVGRWNRVKRLMAPTGIPYDRVQAVVGRQLQLPIPEFSETLFRRCHGKRPNYGQIGCFLSHIKAMRMFLETNEQFAMICEDDIKPRPQLKQILERAIQYNELWDILRLCGFHDAHPQIVCSIGFGRSLAVNMTRLCGTGAYLVTRHAAETLIEKMLPMNVPIDHALDREWFYGLRSLSIDPLPISQNSVKIPSSIPAAKNEKLPRWQRYWTVFPYRLHNECHRLLARRRLFKRSCELATKYNRSAQIRATKKMQAA